MTLTKRISIVVLLMIISAVLIGGPEIIGFLKKIFWPRERIELVKHFPFSEEGSLREWEEKIFKGKVLYSIDGENHRSFVLGSSDRTASALYYKIKLDIHKRPVISWKWNAQKFPLKEKQEDLKNARQDDFAARVYVIFPGFFFTTSKALEYIWTETIPEGTVVTSPYSRNLQLIVAECGKGERNEWVSEYRDIYEDYVMAFGEEPKLNIGAIAFMTDADSTGSTAESFYDEIKIGYQMDEGESK